MDTSGRAILLAGATVVIALLGMFATGVAFMYGLAIAAVIAVLMVLVGLAHAAAGAPLAVRPPARAPHAARSGLLGRRDAAVAGGDGAGSAVAAPRPIGVAAVEPRRAGAAVAAGDRLAGGDDRGR